MNTQPAHFYAAIAYRTWLDNTGAKVSTDMKDRKSLVVITPSYEGHSAFLLHGQILELMSVIHTYGVRYAIEAKDNTLVVEFTDVPVRI